MRDLAEVLDRMKQLPLATVVAELRDLHQRDGVVERAPAGTAPTPAPPVESAVSPSPSVAREAPGGLGAVLDLLRRASDAASVPATAPLPTTLPGLEQAPAFARDDRYALLRTHFGEHELRLRRHALLTDRILSQLERGETPTALAAATPLQEEVRILCRAGGASGGRFLLRNELGRRVLVVLRAHPARGAGPGFAGLHVACDPQQVELVPGEEVLLRVRIDLAGCANPRASGTLELLVDALVDEQVVQKVWIALMVHDATDGKDVS